MIPNEKYFFDTLLSFYEKSVKNHPQRLSLLEKSKKNLSKFVQSRQKSAHTPKKPIITSREKIISTSRLSKSRGKSAESDRESTDSKISHKRLKIDEYFRCQFIYESNSFVKTLMYGYLFLVANVEYADLLLYIKDSFREEYLKDFDESEMKRLMFYLDRIILSSAKKQKYWEKSFTSSFKHLPGEFCNKLFQLLVKMKSDQLYLSKITTLTLRKISQSLGYGINFYHVSKKFIRSEIKEGQEMQYSLSLVYVQQLQKWILSDRPLEKPSEDQSAEKIKLMLGQNISKLLEKYEKQNETLEKLAKMLQEPSSKSAQFKQSPAQVKRSNRIISLKLI